MLTAEAEEYLLQAANRAVQKPVRIFQDQPCWCHKFPCTGQAVKHTLNCESLKHLNAIVREIYKVGA